MLTIYVGRVIYEENQCESYQTFYCSLKRFYLFEVESDLSELSKKVFQTQFNKKT